jgi:diadenosine tetraphosphate (Ap4A) HIT family hydrolase
VIAFSYLIPRRHIPYITDLDGPEAATLGPILARCTSALREATGTTFVFANIFGERVAHLHVNLAPHSPGDALQGGRRMVAEDAPLIGAAELREAADRLSLLLA